MIKLPNGDYLRSDTITAIRKGDASEEHGLHPRVIVDFVNGRHGNNVVLICRDNQERDDLAEKIAAECAP